MTRGAYEFCGADPDDDVDGDGMTPLFSAIAFEAADSSSARSDVAHHSTICIFFVFFGETFLGSSFRDSKTEQQRSSSLETKTQIED